MNESWDAKGWRKTEVDRGTSHLLVMDCTYLGIAYF